MVTFKNAVEEINSSLPSRNIFQSLKNKHQINDILKKVSQIKDFEYFTGETDQFKVVG